MAIQTPALFGSTREYSKHGRVYILLTRIRVRMRCYMWGRLTRCRNSGCRNNDLYPFNLTVIIHRNFLAYVGSGRVGSRCHSISAGRVGSGLKSSGSGRVGSKKMDPWTTLLRIFFLVCVPNLIEIGW
jgi:hypothetical protein